MLVVTNSIARRIRDKRIVARILTNWVSSAFSVHRYASGLPPAITAMRVTVRSHIEIPKSAQKKTGGMVITPVIFKNAVTMPIITLTTIEISTQFGAVQSIPSVFYIIIFNTYSTAKCMG